MTMVKGNEPKQCFMYDVIYLVAYRTSATRNYNRLVLVERFESTATNTPLVYNR